MCVSLKIIPIAVDGDRARFVYADLSVSKEISSAHAGACLDANRKHSTLPVGIFPGSQPKRTHTGGDLKEKSQASSGNTTGVQIVPSGLGMLIFLITKSLLFFLHENSHTIQLAPRCAQIQGPWSRVTGHREAESFKLRVVICLAGSNKRLIKKN